MINRVIDDELERLNMSLTHKERRRLFDMILADPGPFSVPTWLDGFLEHDRSINEIIIIGPHKVIVRRNDDLTVTSAHFNDDLHLLYILNQFLRPLGSYLNLHSPAVHVRFPDQSEMVALMPPFTSNEIFASIRINRAPLETDSDKKSEGRKLSLLRRLNDDEE